MFAAATDSPSGENSVVVIAEETENDVQLSFHSKLSTVDRL
jgi:hypothetical protein